MPAIAPLFSQEFRRGGRLDCGQKAAAGPKMAAGRLCSDRGGPTGTAEHLLLDEPPCHAGGGQRARETNVAGKRLQSVPSTVILPPLNLQHWIRENRKHLVPPVSNKQLFTGADDVIVFVSGGPNTRNDFHVNPTEELFYQLKGDIAVRLRPLDGSAPFDQIVREGELFLLPRLVPHRPQRPGGTVGLIIEFPRPKGQLDGLRWYCPHCDLLVHEARWQLRKIDQDLKIIMEDFWGGPVARRTCAGCGHCIQRAGAIALKSGRVRAAAEPAASAKKVTLKRKLSSATSASASRGTRPGGTKPQRGTKVSSAALPVSPSPTGLSAAKASKGARSPRPAGGSRAAQPARSSGTVRAFSDLRSASTLGQRVVARQPRGARR